MRNEPRCTSASVTSVQPSTAPASRAQCDGFRVNAHVQNGFSRSAGRSKLVTPIEVISFLSRPVSLSVRLFANMLAGHITLKVFAGFVVSLIAAEGFGVLGPVAAILPMLMTIALTALEFLVAFLQAYVFTVLTCMYLNDALHPSH